MTGPQQQDLSPIRPHDHPEPQIMVWSEVEIEWIKRYAAEAVARALAASASTCQSKQPQDLRPDQFCADLTCGFVGGCSRKGGEAPGCVVRDQEAADDAATMDRMADLLTRTVNALRGDPGPLRRWSWHDLPERAAEAVKALEPVAWRWWPSDYWREFVITQDPNRAEEAKTYGLKVEALGVIKESEQ